MKSKEEIEQIASKEYWNNNIEVRSFIMGYNQAIQDMTEIIKYEIKRAFIHGQGNAKSMEAGLERDETEDYVNYRMLSILNKQD